MNRLPDAREFSRMEQAADWVIRLHATTDESAVSEWLRWCEKDPSNLAAFQRAQTVWQAALPPRRRATSWARWGGAIAAGLLIILAGVLSWTRLAGPDGGEQGYSTVTAGRGITRLPDGSTAELGASSRILTQYSRSKRSVTVEAGEAFFTVARDPVRPFTVAAGQMTITALGTAFNVRRGSDRIVVAVSEGKVRITGGEGRSHTDSALNAGQRAAYVLDTKELAITTIKDSDAASWRAGTLKYLHEPLGSVVADLGRYSARPITIDDPQLASIPFTGTVLSDRIEDALRGFEDVFPLRVVEHSDRIELRKK